MSLRVSKLTVERERELLEGAQAGDVAARTEIIRIFSDNVRVDARKWSDSKEDLKELTQEGFIGLNYAIDKFDLNRGTRFSTYANYWWLDKIRRYARVSRAQGRGGVKSILFTDYSKAKKAMDAVLAERLDDPPFELAKRLKWSLKKAESFMSLHKVLLSLNIHKAYTDGEPEEWVNTFKGAADVEKDVEDSRKKLAVEEVMQFLPERERNVIRWRFYRSYTYERVGKILGVSRERARQIEASALRKMQSPLSVRLA